MIPLEKFLERDDCKLNKPRELFVGIYYASSGDPCKGCSYNGYSKDPKMRGKCPAYLALHELDKASRAMRFAQRETVETVREEAARRGLSISEVRRQRSKKGDAND